MAASGASDAIARNLFPIDIHVLMHFIAYQFIYYYYYGYEP